MAKMKRNRIMLDIYILNEKGFVSSIILQRVGLFKANKKRIIPSLVDFMVVKKAFRRLFYKTQRLRLLVFIISSILCLYNIYFGNFPVVVLSLAVALISFFASG